MSDIFAPQAMRPTQSTPRKRALAAAIRANVPVLMWGDPGEGKTAETVTDASAWGFHCEVIVGSNREATDFLGYPLEKDGDMFYSTLGWARRLAEAQRGLLALDEINLSEIQTMKAMHRVLEERWVGDFHLPDSVSIVAMANPTSIATDANDLSAPVANRFMHLDWHSPFDDWLTHVATDFAFYRPPSIESMLGGGTAADKARASGSVIGYLSKNPGAVKGLPTDPQKAGMAWASRRSWTNAMKVLGELKADDDDAAYLVVKGCVGDAASSYFTWLEANDLYDPAQVLAHPSIVNWNGDRPDRIFALMSSILTLVQLSADAATWTKGVKVFEKCASSGKPDLALPGARALFNNIPRGARIPESAVEAFTDIFQRTGQWAS